MVDHAGEPGMVAEAVNDLHRIVEVTLRDDIVAQVSRMWVVICRYEILRTIVHGSSLMKIRRAKPTALFWF